MATLLLSFEPPQRSNTSFCGTSECWKPPRAKDRTPHLVAFVNYPIAMGIAVLQATASLFLHQMTSKVEVPKTSFILNCWAQA